MIGDRQRRRLELADTILLDLPHKVQAARETGNPPLVDHALQQWYTHTQDKGAAVSRAGSTRALPVDGLRPLMEWQPMSPGCMDTESLVDFNAWDTMYKHDDRDPIGQTKSAEGKAADGNGYSPALSPQLQYGTTPSLDNDSNSIQSPAPKQTYSPVQNLSPPAALMLAETPYPINSSSESSSAKEAGAEDTSLEDGGDTPLLLAATRGNLQIINILVKGGANIEAVNCQGQSALHLAADRGDAAIVIALLNLGADMMKNDTVGFTIFHRLIMQDNVPLLKVVLEWCKSRSENRERPNMLSRCVNLRDIKRRSLLHVAVMMERIEVIELLITSGADVNDCSGVE